MKATKVCFITRERSLERLQLIEFYSQDLRVLRDGGFDVRIAIRPQDIIPADLYLVWWWTWAFIPVTYAFGRRPVIVTGVFDPWRFPSRPFYEKQLLKYALRCATANVFVSRLEYKIVPRMAKVRNPRYIPLSVDAAVYRPNPGVRKNIVLTIAKMAGGNGIRKCIPEIIQAAKYVHDQYPEIQFVIAGERDNSILRMAAQAGSASYISFPGQITLKEKIDLLQSCLIYLQPSRFEGFGLAIAEALSCGCPVITSAVGEVPEVVGDAAHFVNGASPIAIAESVKRLFEDGPLRAELSHRGVERVKELYNYGRHRQAWLSLLAEFV